MEIKEQLPELLDLAVQLLQKNGQFLIINTYSTDLSKDDVEKALQITLKKYKLPLYTQAFDLSLPVKGNQILKAGQTVRWTRK